MRGLLGDLNRGGRWLRVAPEHLRNLSEGEGEVAKVELVRGLEGNLSIGYGSALGQE